MIFTPTAIHGAWEILLEPREDERGSFARAFCQREFEAHGIRFDVRQANLAQTRHAGTVRGLHYQVPPEDDAKLVRCLRGAVFDAIVDMRPASPTYRATHWAQLDAASRKALFVPGGVAHGYQALVDDTEFMYMTDRFYAPGLEHGVRFDDPAVGIPWPVAPRFVADRDRRWPLLGTPGA